MLQALKNGANCVMPNVQCRTVSYFRELLATYHTLTT